jgi:predicted amidohydrolase YtcJ
LLLAACSAQPSHTASRADRIFLGAAVYTVDVDRPWAEALAVRDGEILFVGDEEGARGLVGPSTEIVELDGGMILPGFQDAHIHPVMSGVEINQCDLSTAADRDGLFAVIRDCAARQEGEWLLGSGWALPIFPDANPRAEWLEELAPGRPAYLVAADGHSAWVSRAALERAGIDAATADPPRGRIERDPGSGEPTGTLRESATDLVGAHIPDASIEERLRGLERAQESLLAAGVVAVQDALARPEYLEAYRESERRGELELRVVAALATDPARGTEQVDALETTRRNLESERLHPTVAKLFLDGVIEAHTALLLEPYSDRPGDRGLPEWEPERLAAVASGLVEAGFALHFHAIGDGAVRLALDTIEAAESSPGAPGGRPPHQIAHLELIHPDDVPRFAGLGVGAVFQPLWAQADSYIIELTWPVIGAERAAWLYPIGGVERAGGRLAFGSDWSVSSLEPLDGIEVAVTRRAVDDTGEALLPGEAVHLSAAIEAYTLGAAWANGLDADSGSLETGKRADLVVLSDNLFALEADRVADARVLRTVIAGRDVYTAGD